MTTSHDDLTQAFNGIRDSLLAMRDTLNQALGHTAHAQELAADLDDAPGPLVNEHCHKMVTTRDIPAIHVQPGMHVVSCGAAYPVTRVEITEHLATIQLDDAPNQRGGTYLCAPDDDVTVTGDTAVLLPDRLLAPLTAAVHAYQAAVRRKGVDSPLATTRRGEVLDAAYQLTVTLDDLDTPEEEA